MKKVGRPSAAQQAEIMAKLKPYYEMGVTAHFTAQQPGMPHENTIKSYFRVWKEKYIEEESADLGNRQREVKAQFIAAFDKIIFNLSAQLNKYTQAIIEDEKEYRKNNTSKDSKPYKPNHQLESMYKSINKLLADIMSAKAITEAAPYADERTYEATLARLQERTKTVKAESK